MVGKAVILNPLPNTPQLLEVIGEYGWEAGTSQDVLKFVECPENDVEKQLIIISDAAMLTKLTEAAKLFCYHESDIHLVTKTSKKTKNAIIISSAADLYFAVADLINSMTSNIG